MAGAGVGGGSAVDGVAGFSSPFPKDSLTLVDASLPSDRMKYAEEPNDGLDCLLAAGSVGNVQVWQIRNWNVTSRALTDLHSQWFVTSLAGRSSIACAIRL